jgi:hypothetical protein
LNRESGENVFCTINMHKSLPQKNMSISWVITDLCLICWKECSTWKALIIYWCNTKNLYSSKMTLDFKLVFDLSWLEQSLWKSIVQTIWVYKRLNI